MLLIPFHYKLLVVYIVFVSAKKFLRLFKQLFMFTKIFIVVFNDFKMEREKHIRRLTREREFGKDMVKFCTMMEVVCTGDYLLGNGDSKMLWTSTFFFGKTCLGYSVYRLSSKMLENLSEEGENQ